MAIVDTAPAFRDLIAELRKMKVGSRIVLDTETSGVDMFGLGDRYEVPITRPGGPSGELLDPEYGPARICGVALGIPFGAGIRTWYLPYRHLDRVKTATYEHKLKQKQLPLKTLVTLKDVIEERELRVVNHNIKFDLKMLYVDGAMPKDGHPIDDTMLLAHALDERVESFSLENLVPYYTDHPMKYKGWVGDEFKKRKFRVGYAQFPIVELAPYAEDDVRGTWKLFKALYPQLLNTEEPWYGGQDLADNYEAEMQALWVTTWMEIRGMKIDVEKCRTLHEQTARDYKLALAKLRKLIHDSEFNPHSPKQLEELFAARGWPTAEDPLKGTITFQDMTLFKLLPQGPDKKPLEHPDHPGLKEFISLLVRVRSLRKFGETYFGSYLRLADSEGFLHANFNQHGTVTGRLSSSKPNFQNIPKTIATGRTALQKAAEEIVQSPVRGIIIPRTPDHRIVNIDFSQQEIRLFLHYVDEPKMREIVANGGDVHHFAASQMFNGMPDKDKYPDEYKRKRHMAKFINFGIIYGMGRRKLQEMFEISWTEADEYYNNYLAMFPHIKEFIEIVRGIADSRKWVKNAFGRRRRMRILTAEEKRTGKVKTGIGYTQSVRATDSTADAHKALNSIIQGGAADLVKRSMVRCHALLRGTRSYLVNQIHDELVFEIHKDEMDELLPKIKVAMTDWPQFTIPFTVDVSIAQGAWDTSEASRA